MTITVPVPTGEAPEAFQRRIKEAQNTAKNDLLIEINSFGGLVAKYDETNSNKIIITIPANSTKSVDVIKAELQRIQSVFNEKEENKKNHISFGDVTSSDGECGVRKIKGRSPAKDGGRKRKGSPKRH